MNSEFSFETQLSLETFLEALYLVFACICNKKGFKVIKFWNIYYTSYCIQVITQDMVVWNIFTLAIFFLKCMHLHTKGRGEVKFWIILYLYQIDDPQKRAKWIIFYHLTLIVSEICWYGFRFIWLLM